MRQIEGHDRSGRQGHLSVRRQCELLAVARSGVYRAKSITAADDLALMRRLDELHLKLPFYGSRRMQFELNKEGHAINRKRVQRLMRVMGLVALVPRPGTSKAAPRPQDIPVSTAQRGDQRAKSCLGGGHNLRSDGARFSLSHGGD